MVRRQLSRCLHASLLVMASLLLASRESTATTPPMYSIYFVYAAPDEDERGIIDKPSEVVLQNAIESFWYTPNNSVCITGYYDRTGPLQDRMKKSQVLAESVAAYLVDHGIPAASIKTTWKGDIDLMVPTADGVAEPANRSVLILVGDGTYKSSC